LTNLSASIKSATSFIELSDAEVAKFKAAVEPVIGTWTQSMVDKGFTEAEVKSWIDFMGERIEYWRAKQIAWRIPSAAGPPEVKPEALQ